ncbi:ATP-binding protein [Actinokineospora globicatena]|uniref:ATP-binding protein n=1 Tax=Actinokineospora globicatena TaxID=103729 RepID=UPI0020A3DF08|nr:ATP-binding protein [Actinokineospora globicatena]MCP2305852.1 Cyclic nucleotide-binding domain-containing protein [Actinokineospora globicatena]GLW80281.1 histidine kinase [Actinokineospora globicatena]GLW87110.1 histidine kinase [Actinokineospora globicatena]
MTPDEIRGLFLFESLDDEQLAWLAEHGVVETSAAGTEVLAEGDPATCFFVLLDGTVSLLRTIGGERAEISRTDHRGSYFGATQAYLQDDVTSRRVYLMTVVAVTDVRMLQLPAAEFGPAVRSWFPMGVHLLEGLFWGMQATQAVVSQRERLLALGSLTAGLTHELNNPAAAAVRATAALRERVAGMRHKLSLLASGTLDPATLPALVRLQEEAVERVAKAPRLSPMEASDREDELADWLTDHGIAGGWDLAPVLVAGGLDVTWLATAVGTCPVTATEAAVRWLAYTVETEALINEIEDSTTRVSTLVGAAKQYSQLDRAPFQVVDVHDLLDATLVMLGGKFGTGVQVHKEYDRSVPLLPGYAAELNQVWTNLIDNALAAMNGSGVLTLRTSHSEGRLLVEIADTGSGIPPEVVSRVFEPFFTTKPVGEGTGLGLDISWRIVVAKHHGDIRVESEPGDTRFRVWLPLTQP